MSGSVHPYVSVVISSNREEQPEVMSLVARSGHWPGVGSKFKYGVHEVTHKHGQQVRELLTLNPNQTVLLRVGGRSEIVEDAAVFEQEQPSVHHAMCCPQSYLALLR